jgi:hypothetical protein
MRSLLNPRFGGPQPSGSLDVSSRALAHWLAEVPAWRTSDGAHLSITAHEWTWTRGGTATQAATDSDGVSYTATAAMPAWEARDLDGDGDREAIGLRMGTSDRLTCTTPPIFTAHSGRLDFIETGAISTSGATLFAIANDTVAGVRLWIDTDATYYGVNWNDGSTTRTARLTVAPTTNDLVALSWTLATDGALTVTQRINNGGDTIAVAAALTLATAWGTAARMRLNSRGDTENPAQGWYRRLLIVPAQLDLDAIGEVW